jgi:intein/homing endonuclease
MIFTVNHLRGKFEGDGNIVGKIENNTDENILFKRQNDSFLEGLLLGVSS